MGKYFVNATEHLKFEIHRGKDADERYHWQLRYHGDIIATGHQMFDTPEKCIGEINLVKLCLDARIEHNY